MVVSCTIYNREGGGIGNACTKYGNATVYALHIESLEWCAKPFCQDHMNLDLGKRGEENQELKRDFELSFLCLPHIKFWEFLRKLEVRAIGQCLWLPTMCFRSIHKLSGGNTQVCELL